MSIVTKRGDDGLTDRLYGTQIPKSSQLIEAIGSLDELNAWIGYAAGDIPESDKTPFPHIQQTLTSIMGELSAGSNNFERYQSQFKKILTSTEIEQVENLVYETEKDCSFDGWQTPNTKWDIACRVCRRAERQLWKYSEEPSTKIRKEVLIYINRLSDLLWILGR